MVRDTQLGAYKAIQPHVPNMRDRILELIKADPSTCSEIEQLTGYRQSTANGRISEMARDGILVDSGERRLTASGRPAIVWKAAQ